MLLGKIGKAMALATDGALLVWNVPDRIRPEPLGISGAEITAERVTLPLGRLSLSGARTAVVRLICPLVRAQPVLTFRCRRRPFAATQACGCGLPR